VKKVFIPQEENKTTNGQKKVMYAPNDDGKFETFKYGSSVEEYATSLAVEEYKILMEQSRRDIIAGISSPIEYLMYQNRMDLPTLSSIVNMFQFRVKRHLKGNVFQKMNDPLLKKYADAFGIDLEELKGLEFND